MISFPYHQKGLSLVELLIAMLLGLILTAGALQMMLSSQEIYKTTDTLSRIQESGRFTLNFLTKDIRMAGHNTTKDADGKVFWDGACGASNPCTSNGGGNNSDQIGVLMDPADDADCLGNAVADEDTVIANVYYIDDPENDLISSLYCRGYDISANGWVDNGGAQPLVDGVENMQILYGITDPVTNAITSYVDAGDVTDWANIGAVKVSVLMNNGQAQGNGNNEIRNFNLLDADPITVTDQHNRQAFSTSIVVNNIIYQSKDSNL